MTFFDKFFASSKSKLFRGKNEDIPTCTESEPSDLAPEKIRVVVFRECERRGRKLLLDSDAVEKLGLDAAAQATDVVEVTATHAYKYKKPGKDVASMGEMIFGSVGLSTKVRVSYKIHVIPAPQRTILYTTVVPCITRCNPHQSSIRRFSGTKPESNPPARGGCASDSAMYRGQPGLHRTSGYASLRTLAPGPACCDSDTRDSLRVPAGCESRLSVSSGAFRICESPLRRPSDAPSVSSCSSQGDSRASNLSSNCSAGSLTSLRRRWQQSLAVSLDGSSCDESEGVTGRVRTKLGICLVLNLSGPVQMELEKYLLANSKAVDDILARLQQEVEIAYTRLDTFVHLTMTATKSAADSICRLVADRRPAIPRWMNPNRACRSGCCQSANSVGQDGLPRWLLPNACSANTTAAQNFVTAFYDIVRQYDTKNTNFFVSTLLTAMLTHNLGWAVEIHKRNSSDEMDYIMDNANSSKVVITDTQVKPTLTTLIDVLSFFLRNSCTLEHTLHAEYATVTDPSRVRPTKTDKMPQEVAGINGCDLPSKNKENKQATLNGLTKKSVGNVVDEGYGQETVGEASKRWRAVAKLVMAAKEAETKKLVSSAENSSDGGTVPCSGDENFDSGIDCELRDAVACVLAKPVAIPKSKQVLVSSAPVKALTPASVGRDVVAELSDGKSISPKTDISSEERKMVEGKGLRKTVTHFNFSEMMESPEVFEGPNDESGFDECDGVARERVDSVYEAMEMDVPKERVLWTLGENETLGGKEKREEEVEEDKAERVGLETESDTAKKPDNHESAMRRSQETLVVPNSQKTEKPKASFVDQIKLKPSSKDCCNSMQPTCSHGQRLQISAMQNASFDNPGDNWEGSSLLQVGGKSTRFSGVVSKEISVNPILLPSESAVPPEKYFTKDCEVTNTLPTSPKKSDQKCPRKSWPVGFDFRKEDFVLSENAMSIIKTFNDESSDENFQNCLKLIGNDCYLPACENALSHGCNFPKKSSKEQSSEVVPVVTPVVLVGKPKEKDRSSEGESTESLKDVLLCCAPKRGNLYPDLTELARLENICLDDLSSAQDQTLFVADVLRKAEMAVSPSSDEGYYTLYGEEAKKLLEQKENVIKEPIYTKSASIECERESATAPPRRRRKIPARSVTVNIPLVAGLTMLRQRSRTMDSVVTECPPQPPPPTLDDRLTQLFVHLPMPLSTPVSSSRVVPSCSLVGGVSTMVYPHLILQGVTGGVDAVETMLRNDLAAACRSAPDTVSVLADMQSWGVWVHRSDRTSMGSARSVRASACPLVADMVESFALLHRIGLPSGMCQEHLERKLEEIYNSSKLVADFLMNREELITVDALTSHLDLNVNDVPLLLSVAAVHTPEIAEFYGVTIT